MAKKKRKRGKIQKRKTNAVTTQNGTLVPVFGNELSAEFRQRTTICWPEPMRDAALRAMQRDGFCSMSHWVQWLVWPHLSPEERAAIAPMLAAQGNWGGSFRQSVKNKCRIRNIKITYGQREEFDGLTFETIILTAPDGWRWFSRRGPKSLECIDWQDAGNRLQHAACWPENAPPEIKFDGERKLPEEFVDYPQRERPSYYPPKRQND